MYPVTEEQPPQEEVPIPPTPEELQKQEEDAQAEAEAAEEELDAIILDLVKEAEKEDLDLRYTLVHIWKRNNYYFNNIQTIFFDPVAKDYRSLNAVMDELVKAGINTDIKIINIYRAYAESIIAALSVEVPAVEFSPDDAEDDDDIETAEAYARISRVVQNHNHAALKLIKSLTIFYNQGVIFGHNVYRRDPSYGTIDKPKTVVQKPQNTNDLRCPQCGELHDSDIPDTLIGQESTINCQYCGYSGPPDVHKHLIYVDEVTEWETTAKGRTAFDIYGPVHVKAPLYAKEQKDVGYLILREEDHIARYKEEYGEDYADDIAAEGSGDLEKYERWGRIPVEYNGGIPKDIATRRTAFIRPWYYNTLDKERAAKIRELFPEGLKTCVIGDVICSKESNKLDEEWTISYDPRSDFIHAEPSGNAAIPIQDATTDVFNLGLQCIEFGIPETFANPKTLNFKKYSEQQATPGMITPALPPGPDKSIADGFHTVKTATLSNEYTTFDAALKTKGEFVTGAIPSIWGGSLKTGGNTATEVTSSKGQALQRLQITWRMVKIFWSSLIYKSCVDYAKNLQEDEKHTEKKNGTFVSTWIKKSQLTGKVGQIEPDMNEQLPQSWAQRREFITKMIEVAPDAVGPILMHPNNSEILKNFAGIPDIYIPGEKDRTKQYNEFYRMARGEEVAIDVVVDDHPIHMEVLKNILVSNIGMALEPEIYQINIAHYQEHEMAQKAKTIASSGITSENEPAQSATDTTQG